MPVVSIFLDTLFELTKIDPLPHEELRKLLQRFGLELDELSEENGRSSAKVEVPANRPDLLSVEAIAIALKAYITGEPPRYTVIPGDIEFTYDESVASVRPVLCSSVLRNIHFNDESYASFIEMQEKFHQNLCRRRTLASIGTHDLRKCRPPFRYSAEPPEEIVFVPLTGGEAVDGHQLFDNLKHHQQLSKYLYLLDNQPLWPVIRDADGEVCSLPPIINSDKTRIDKDTTDVFIECTAMDQTRALTSVVCLSAAFSIYSKTPFAIEQVNIIRNGEVTLSPTFDFTEFLVDVEYIRVRTGLRNLPVNTIIKLLAKMMLSATSVDGEKLRVIAPPTRSDVLHPCDIAEDVAIGYGYDLISRELTRPVAAGCPLGINELSDRIRREIVACGWSEILTFSLCGTKDCYDLLGLPRANDCVVLKNAKTVDYEIVRTTLLPGLLRVTKNILEHPGTKGAIPLRIFEISDVVLLDSKTDTGARNERRICATIADVKSKFQEIHGLLDRFFVVNGRPVGGYTFLPEDSPTCIPGQRALVKFEGNVIGWIGVIHPNVLTNFDLTTPIVAFELQIEPFMEKPSPVDRIKGKS